MEEETTGRLWEMTPARKAAMQKNIKKAQAAKRAKAGKGRRREPRLEVVEVPLQTPPPADGFESLARLIVAVARVLSETR